jgi:hypothetical protein
MGFGNRVMAILFGAGALLVAGCGGGPTSPDLVTSPIQVDSVDVTVLESSPPQVAVQVQGVLGDGCSTLHSVAQQRVGNVVTVTILRERPRDAVCTQIAKLYDEVIRLDGTFPPGDYVLRVNSVEKPFSTS